MVVVGGSVGWMRIVAMAAVVVVGRMPGAGIAVARRLCCAVQPADALHTVAAVASLDCDEHQPYLLVVSGHSEATQVTQDCDCNLCVLVDGDDTAVAVYEIPAAQVGSSGSVEAMPVGPVQDYHCTRSDTVALQKSPDSALVHVVMVVKAAHCSQHPLMRSAMAM